MCVCFSVFRFDYVNCSLQFIENRFNGVKKSIGMSILSESRSCILDVIIQDTRNSKLITKGVFFYFSLILILV